MVSNWRALIERVQNVARRRTKKSLSLHEDKFRQSVFNFANFLDKYKYAILLAAAAIATFSVAFYLRSEGKAKQIEYTMRILASDVKVSPDELKDRAEKSRGSPLEPWVILAYGNRLFELYQDQDITKGDKSRLLLAKKAFEDVRDRFSHNGSAYFCALKSLEAVQEELGFEMNEPKEEAKQPQTRPVEQQSVPPKGRDAATPSQKSSP